jgi:hypothetical protein
MEALMLTNLTIYHCLDVPSVPVVDWQSRNMTVMRHSTWSLLCFYAERSTHRDNREPL